MDLKTPIVHFTAAECAAQTGLTIRALRLYERHGLITPRRTSKNWRFYSVGDIARLNEIIILKGFGLPLTRIARLLAGKETDLATVLSVQADALQRQRARVESSLAVIKSVQGELAAGSASVSALINLAKEMAMTHTATDNIAWKLYEQARPRTGIALDPETLNDYHGYFRLNGSALVTVVPGTNSIDIAVTGQPLVTLQPEARDRFFAKALPLQIVFNRDAEGEVTGLAIHQAGLELAAQRIANSEAEAFKAALGERIAHKVAFPGSESMLRRMISDAQAGNLDASVMTEEMAETVIGQERIIRAEMDKAGPLQSLEFEGVGEDGWDVYQVTFANTRHQWRIHLDPDSKVSGLFFRPAL